MREREKDRERERKGERERYALDKLNELNLNVYKYDDVYKHTCVYALDKLNELNLNELHSHSLDLNQESLY